MAALGRWRVCFFLALVWAASVERPVTCAQASPSAEPERADEPGEPEGYRAVVAEAVRELSEGHPEEARALFLRAHALFPNARTHRGIGIVEFELRNYVASVAQLEAALASRVRPLDEPLRREVEQLLARARGFVASVRIETRPSASALLLDGQPAGPSLVLEIGEHVIEARARGHAPERRKLSVRGGETQIIQIEFITPVAPAREADAPPRRWTKRPWLWVGLGVVVAGATVGAVVAARARDSGGPSSPQDGSINLPAP